MYSDTVTTDYWVGPKLLCVEMHYSSYSGGAHPNSWRVAVNFDLNTGEAVKLMELAEDSEGLRAAVKEKSAVPDPRERHLGGIRSRGLLRGL